MSTILVRLLLPDRHCSIYPAAWQPSRDFSTPHLGQSVAPRLTRSVGCFVVPWIPSDRVESRSIAVFSITRDIEIEYQGERAARRGLCRGDLQDDFAPNIVLSGPYGRLCPRICRRSGPLRRLSFGCVVHPRHYSTDVHHRTLRI